MVLRWLISLGAKFLRIVPFSTCGIVLIAILSQMTLLLAFFLPLKVVVLLGSTGMPRYFPSSWQVFDRDFLILLLSAAAFVFYVLHLLSENLIGRLTNYGASQLLLSSQKLILFENQDEVAAKAYSRYSSALSGAVFAVLAIVVLFWLYPKMALVAPSVVLTFLCVAWGSSVFFRTSQKFWSENLSGIASLYSGFGFLLAFSYLVLDFLFLSPPGLMHAVVALLLMRQFFRRTSVLLLDTNALFKQRHMLDALFFHGQAFVPQEKLEKQREIWQVLEPEERSRWVGSVLAEIVGDELDPAGNCEWLDTAVLDVFAVQCNHKYVLKLLGKKRVGWAQHEAFLLFSPVGAQLPAPKLCAATVVDGFPCHVFEASDGLRKLNRKQARVEVCSLWVNMVSVAPPTSLVKQHERSHVSLFNRLNETVLLRLSWVVNSSSERARIVWLANRLPSFKRRLARMPLAFTNPDINMNLYIDGKGDIVTAQWGRWGIEPFGAMLPILLRDRIALQQALVQVQKVRQEMSGVTCQDVLLVAHIFELERFVEKQCWVEAVDSVNAVCALLEEGVST